MGEDRHLPPNTAYRLGHLHSALVPMVKRLPVVVRMLSGCGTCRTERAKLQGHSSRVWEVAFNPAGQTSRVAVQTVQLDVECPRWHLPQNVSGTNQGVRSVSFSPMAPCQPVAVTMPSCGSGIGERQAKDTQVDLGSGISSNGQMVASGSGSNRAALGCARWYLLPNIAGQSLVCSLSFSPNGHTLQVAVIKPCGSGMCKMATASEPTRTYGWGLGSRLAQMDTPLQWQQ